MPGPLVCCADMSGLNLQHADPLFKRLARSKLPDAARSYAPHDVVEERWSRDDMFHLDPVYWEVRGIKPGRWARKKLNGYPATRHLFDAEGRVLAMVSEHDYFGDGRLRRDESLVRRSDGQTIVAHVNGALDSSPPELTRLDWADSEGNRPTLIETRDLHHAMRSRLFYEGDRLVRIEREDEDTRLNAGNVRRSIITVSYDSIGRRERVEKLNADKPDGVPRVLFQSKAGGPTLKEATARLREVLRNAIVSAARSMNIDEPVWCVKLMYAGSGGTVLPPSVVVCTRAKRDEIIASGEPREVWNESLYPDAHQLHELEPFADQAALATLINVLDDQPESKQIKLLRELAVELTSSVVEDAIQPTGDFGVVAVDGPHDDLAKAMRASVPKDVIQKWKQAGII